jgi:alpha-tubulin suppressor-like RCC1 family protein/uncharacterized protein YjdB
VRLPDLNPFLKSVSILALLLTACSQSLSSGSGTEVSIRLTVPGAAASGRAPLAAVPETVASISIEVSGPGAGARTDRFSVTPGETVVRTLDVESGPDRVFRVTASDETDTPLYRGVSEPVELLPNEPVTVPITMQPLLVSIAVTPANASIGQGITWAFAATGTYGDGSTRNITSSVTWTSGDPSVATVSDTGAVTAVALGTTTITATDPEEGVSGSTDLTVIPAKQVVSIDVAPANPTVAKGLTVSFTATGTNADDSQQDLTPQVTWQTSNANVVSIGTGGSAVAEGVGTATITATDPVSGISASTTMTVTAPELVAIGVIPSKTTIAAGLTVQFTATGLYTDNTVNDLTATATWSSSAPAVANISPAGLATGIAAGTTTITAQSGSIVGSATLDVTPPIAISLDSGGSHTCVILSDKTVKCWGDNTYFELGTASVLTSNTPISVGGVGSATAIAAGGDSVDGPSSAQTCAVVADGTLQCWGDGVYGQLGNADFAGSSSPVQVCDIGEGTFPCPNFLSGVISVTAGGRHTCALGSNGLAECWGDNFFGEMGIGTGGSVTNFPYPLGVCADASCDNIFTNVVDLSAGLIHTCAVRSDTSVWCWGDNTDDQLGTGSSGGTSDFPVQVCGAFGIGPCPQFLTGAVSVSAHHDHSCVVTSSGGVRCWGLGNGGGLGDGTTNSSAYATQVCAPGQTAPCSTFFTGAAAVSSGFYFSCALKTDGTVWCWGNNTDGELGDGTFSQSSVPVQVCAAGGCSRHLGGVTAISAGDYHACALLATGGVRCWGDDSYGQLGDGANTPSGVPVVVQGIP